MSYWNILIHTARRLLQANAEKMGKQHEMHLAELQSKLDEQQRSILELNNNKSRMFTESEDLARQLEDAESQIGQLSKVCICSEYILYTFSICTFYQVLSH